MSADERTTPEIDNLARVVEQLRRVEATTDLDAALSQTEESLAKLERLAARLRRAKAALKP